MDKSTKVTIGGVDYKLLFSVNAMIEFEDVTGQSVSGLENVLKDMGKGKFDVKLMRQLFHSILYDYHPELDLKSAGLLMAELGFLEAAELVAHVMVSAFPQAKGAGARGKPAPRKRKAKPAPRQPQATTAAKSASTGTAS